MAVCSRDPRGHWLKPHFSKNEVAKSGGLAVLLKKLRGDVQVARGEEVLIKYVFNCRNVLSAGLSGRVALPVDGPESGKRRNSSQ